MLKRFVPLSFGPFLFGPLSFGKSKKTGVNLPLAMRRSLCEPLEDRAMLSVSPLGVDLDGTDGSAWVGTSGEGSTNNGVETTSNSLTGSLSAPVLSARMIQYANGASVKLTVNGVFPDNPTISQWAINWGDGTIETFDSASSALTVTHFYTPKATEQTYALSVQILDTDGNGADAWYSVGANSVAALGDMAPQFFAPHSTPSGNFSITAATSSPAVTITVGYTDPSSASYYNVYDYSDEYAAFADALAYANSVGNHVIGFDANMTIQLDATTNTTLHITNSVSVVGYDTGGTSYDVVFDGGTQNYSMKLTPVTYGGVDTEIYLITPGTGAAAGTQIFMIDSGNTGDVAFVGITLKNGFALGKSGAGPTDHGGAIAIFGSGDVTIDGCNFYDNYASSGLENGTGTGTYGGAIYVGGDYSAGLAYITVNNSYFEGNAAAADGGCIAIGTGAVSPANLHLAVNDSTFTGNYATAQDKITASQYGSSAGAAIYNTGGGHVKIDLAGVTGSTFSGNYAYQGVAVFHDLATGTIYIGNSTDANCITTFEGNNTNLGGSGGALYLNRGSIYVQGCQIGTDDDDLPLYNVQFLNNIAAWNAGAIYMNNAAGTVYIQMGYFSGNQATIGGAIRNRGGVIYIVDSTFTNNSAYDETDDEYFTAWRGGAIRNEGTIYIDTTTWQTPTVGSIFINNRAGYGGGIYTDGGSVHVGDHVQLVDTYFTNNVAAFDGGAIYTAGTTTITLWSNLANGERDIFFTGNHARQNGGAIYSSTGGSISALGGVFNLNSADGSGGAIYNAGGNFNLLCSELTNNSAVFDGGAIWTGGTGGTFFRIDHGQTAYYNLEYTLPTLIDGNSAGRDGGAIFINAGQMAVGYVNASVTFSNNIAARDGGGIYNGGGTLAIDGSGDPEQDPEPNDTGTLILFQNNIAGGNGGAIANGAAGSRTILDGKYYGDGTETDPYIFSIQFEGNEATGLYGSGYGSGGALYNAAVIGSGMYITGTSFTGNIAYHSGGALRNLATGSMVSINNSYVADNIAENGHGGGLSTGIDGRLEIDRVWTVTGIPGVGTISSTPTLGIVFERNQATGTDPGVVGDPNAGTGGALYLGKGATLVIGDKLYPTIHTIFFENYAATNGGAIFSCGDSITIYEPATFIENSAGHNGGAIQIDGGQLIAIGTFTPPADGDDVTEENYSIIFNGNFAGTGIPDPTGNTGVGGAIHNISYTATDGLYLSGVAFTYNSATNAGGAIRNFNGSTGGSEAYGFSVNDCLFDFNWAEYYRGGAIATNVHGSVTIDQAWDSGTGVTNTPLYGTIFRNNMVLYDNTANDPNPSGVGGAIFLRAGSTLSIGTSGITTVFEGNNANYFGGAIYISADVTANLGVAGSILHFLGNLTFSDTSGGGGAIYNAGTLTILGTAGGSVLFDENSAGRNGGAILNYGGASLTIEGVYDDDADTYSVIFSNNTTLAHNGGAIYNWGMATITESAFVNNQAGINDDNAVNGGYGGAIYNYTKSSDDPSMLTLQGVLMDGNLAAYNGGAVFNASNGILTVEDSENSVSSTFTNNKAGYVFTEDDGLVQSKLARLGISGNYAGSGGAVASNGLAQFFGVLFDGNVAAVNGGALSLSSLAGSVQIIDCTFNGNTGRYGGAIINGTSLQIMGNTTFSNNVAITGGAIDNATTGILTLYGGGDDDDSATLRFVDNFAYGADAYMSYLTGLDLADDSWVWKVGDKIIGSNGDDTPSGGNGGALNNQGLLDIYNRVLFESNTAYFHGGAIANNGATGGKKTAGTLLLYDETFLSLVDNECETSDGGGIYNLGEVKYDTTLEEAVWSDFILHSGNKASLGSLITNKGTWNNKTELTGSDKYVEEDNP